jgi:hypothetical protein
MRKTVVVFDIDDTLCTIAWSEDLKAAKAINTECPIINWKDKRAEVHPHVFVPYLGVLFEYLVKNGVRVVFFSSAVEERNNTVIPKLLKKVLGKERYESLHEQGQFEIFSRQHLREGDSDFGEYGNDVKDLAKVIKEGEDLADAILVEDQPTYTAYGQWPCIKVLDCMLWDITGKNDARDSYPKNTVYHLLGLFKTYFENEEYKQMPLRKGIEKLCPIPPPRHDNGIKRKNQPPPLFRPDNDQQFTYRMICLGLDEVRKKHKKAIVYGKKLLKEYIKGLK